VCEAAAGEPSSLAAAYGGFVEVLDLLAQNYFGNTREGSLAGPIGGFIIAALAVTTVLLIRNMSKRIRRLPAEFPERTDTSAETVSDKSDAEQRTD
jgi:hypothetical protein